MNYWPIHCICVE